MWYPEAQDTLLTCSQFSFEGGTTVAVVELPFSLSARGGLSQSAMAGSSHQLAAPPVRKKELLELLPTDTFPVVLVEDQKIWESPPSPAR